MDWMTVKSKISAWIKEYKYIAIVLAIGVILMIIPSPEKPQTEALPQTQIAEEKVLLQDALGSILSSLEGAGKVKVLLTLSQGEKILYQTDYRQGQSQTEEDTVIISGSEREQQGLIMQIIPPKYQGAIVLCQGADNAYVKLEIVNAISNATGLSTDKITVLKMK